MDGNWPVYNRRVSIIIHVCARGLCWQSCWLRPILIFNDGFIICGLWNGNNFYFAYLFFCGYLVTRCACWEWNVFLNFGNYSFIALGKSLIALGKTLYWCSVKLDRKIYSSNFTFEKIEFDHQNEKGLHKFINNLSEAYIFTIIPLLQILFIRFCNFSILFCYVKRFCFVMHVNT